MKTKYLDAVLAAAFLAMVASAFSYTWTPMDPASSGTVMSMSADGRIICSCPSTGGQLRISRDRGQTWSIATNAPPGGSLSGNPVAITADGSQILACLSSNVANQTSVFLSTDCGTNWTKLGLPSLASYDRYCVACSANGSNMVAAHFGGLLYFSTNNGASWITSSVPSTNWISVACSADGKRVVGAVKNGQIYLSTNLGADWTPTLLPVQGWNSVCISADGKGIGAIGTNAYISQNGGANWITNRTSGNSIACSADGVTWMLAGKQVSTSSDGGATWSTNFSNAGWGGAMSADGCEIAVYPTLGLGGLTNWVGRITPSPQMNIESAGSNLMISWLLPSTNFLLQQSADLSNPTWTPVSITPTLNSTNLKEEATVPAVSSYTFFRLTAQ